jgi:hypothetical protein
VNRYLMFIVMNAVAIWGMPGGITSMGLAIVVGITLHFVHSSHRSPGRSGGRQRKFSFLKSCH